MSAANKGIRQISKVDPRNVIRNILKKAFGRRIGPECKDRRKEYKILDLAFSRMAATIIIILRRVNCQ
jgi:hypothetical protein